ncbi:hypothetical protein Tco_0805807 [Tanacetum coccineum]
MVMAYRTYWIRGIQTSSRYGISYLLGTVYWATPVRCFGVLRNNQKRLMRADELYKFCDGTLKDIVGNFRIHEGLTCER